MDSVQYSLILQWNKLNLLGWKMTRRVSFLKCGLLQLLKSCLQCMYNILSFFLSNIYTLMWIFGHAVCSFQNAAYTCFIANNGVCTTFLALISQILHSSFCFMIITARYLPLKMGPSENNYMECNGVCTVFLAFILEIILSKFYCTVKPASSLHLQITV